MVATGAGALTTAVTTVIAVTTAAIIAMIGLMNTMMTVLVKDGVVAMLHLQVGGAVVAVAVGALRHGSTSRVRFVIEKAIPPRTASGASRMMTLPHMMTRRLRWPRTEWTPTGTPIPVLHTTSPESSTT
jgi:hypothetical protein